MATSVSSKLMIMSSLIVHMLPAHFANHLATINYCLHICLMVVLGVIVFVCLCMNGCYLFSLVYYLCVLLEYRFVRRSIVVYIIFFSIKCIINYSQN